MLQWNIINGTKSKSFRFRRFALHRKLFDFVPKFKVIEPLFYNTIEDFKNSVNPLAARIESLPPMILVFGGKKSV